MLVLGLSNHHLPDCGPCKLIKLELSLIHLIILDLIVLLICRYVPNELRGGMMGLSLVPANAGILPSLVQVSVCTNLGFGWILLLFPVVGLAIYKSNNIPSFIHTT